MAVRNDYKCQVCGLVFESVGKPKACPRCRSKLVRLVFAQPRNVSVRSYYMVDHVIAENRKKMKRVYEEDGHLGSEFAKWVEEELSRDHG